MATNIIFFSDSGNKEHAPTVSQEQMLADVHQILKDYQADYAEMAE